MPNVRRSRQAARHPAALVLSAVAAVLLVAACGSSSSGSSASGSASGGSKLSAADQAGLAKAQAFLAKAVTRPTQITNTVKIAKPIPKGKTVDFITCGATPEAAGRGG